LISVSLELGEHAEAGAGRYFSAGLVSARVREAATHEFPVAEKEDLQDSL
jgi:hypothetical protein